MATAAPSSSVASHLASGSWRVACSAAGYVGRGAKAAANGVRDLASRQPVAAATVAGGAAAPVAVTGTVAAAGFGSSGIAAGSYAAGMMSSAAVANGGGVAAGGLVATCQSIGVVGLSATGVGLAVVAGVVVVGGTAYGAKELYNRYHQPKPPASTPDLPLRASL